MERKRKLPARSTRAEPVSKKRAPSKSPDSRQTPTQATAAPTPVVQEERALPTSIEADKPLPTVDKPQPEILDPNEYQSISESGVLAESLHRSRMKWISEGIFEKYWTKPKKKKGVLEAPVNNPPKESMTRLGTCTITVEPHSFDATMWVVKDPNPRPAFTSAPMYRPIIQYGPPNNMMPPPVPTPPVQQKQPPPQPTPQASPRGHDIVMKNSSPAPSQTQPPYTATPQSINASTHNSTMPSNPPPASATTQSEPAPQADKSKDPVIQMLAERASTDTDLKALMRIVANGQASSEQLKRFQSHIDDLTRLQKSRETSVKASPQPASIQPSASPLTARPVNPPAQPPVQTSAPSPAPSIRTAPTPPPTTPTPQYQSQPQALRSKGPVPNTKPDISHVLFEFTGDPTNTDVRYAFPKFSILEYQQNQVIASFLIVRKGSESNYPGYNPEMDYYQPVTIRIYAHQGRQLEALQKVAAPQEEVRRYMDEIMDNATRAEYVLLAMRLPKKVEQSPPADISTVTTEKPDEPAVESQVLWATTNNTPSNATKTSAKAPKKLIDEQGKYQSFIESVSSTV